MQSFVIIDFSSKSYIFTITLIVILIPHSIFE